MSREKVTQMSGSDGPAQSSDCVQLHRTSESLRSYALITCDVSPGLGGGGGGWTQGDDIALRKKEICCEIERSETLMLHGGIF
jgi:hypothetical protein